MIKKISIKNLGIKTRVILLGTVPALLFAIILAGYAVSNVFEVLDQSARDHGQIIAAQLAPTTEYGVISGNTVILQKLVQQAIANEGNLTTAMVLNNDGVVLASSGRSLPQIAITEILKKNEKIINLSQSTIFKTPIIRSLIEVDDFAGESNKKNGITQTDKPLQIGQVIVEFTNQSLINAKRDLMAKIVVIGLLGLALSALVAWWIGRNITKPIKEIANAVNKLKEGNFTEVILENSSGELKTLQKGFNSMASSLKQAHASMQDKIDDATSMLSYQATHDDLTGLINRREFELRLKRSIKSAHKDKLQHIFCFLDLDQFKLVNDTCGHAAGDDLLKQVSSLLDNSMRDRDTIARLGGDEFGILLENCNLVDANQITNIVLKLIRDYRFTYEDQIFNIGVSIGLVIVNNNFITVSEVIHAGDLACYSAKKAGRNQSFMFNEGDVEVAQRRSQVEAILDMTDKIDDDQFMLYCQPIVPLRSNVPQQPHFEILIRKISVDGNIVLPTTFIPSAERYHLMPNIDRWVIKNTFAAYRNLLNISLEKCNYFFSINLSGTSLADKSLLGYIREQLTIYAIPPQAICFEITETSAIVNLNNTNYIFSALRKLGCSFALDDFGSGMSSFTYLKNFEVDYLKIDGSFIKEMHTNKIDHAMVRSIHSVAEAMNIKTVAEFVENGAILKELRAIGVHYGQGQYLGSPIPIKQLTEDFLQLHK